MFKIIANDKNIIPYRKELNLITGGALESIFLAQLLYWYEVNDCNEFFKFREPCEHSLYKEGDSWVEELGFSIKIIDRIIKVFKDKGFLTTRTTMDRVTYYALNIELINELLESIYENTQTAFTKIPKGELRKPPKGNLPNCPKGNYETAKRGTSNKNNKNSSRDYFRDYSETTSDIKEKNLKKESPSNFKKPSLEELESYAKEIEANFSVNHFFDYYEANGWKVGKNSMKDWRATMRMWKHRGELNTQNTHKAKSEISDEERNEFFAKQASDDILSKNWLSRGVPSEVKEVNQKLDSQIEQEIKRKFIQGVEP
ncbi:hypothetical protein [Campylobacter devanensis]|uniref:hypothetical protein n=1 Tax=Campylobacter devanensis TaxID=3161138 RepID=UPI000A3406C5|nr:hypothetical protein [Campylobacter sp. P0106]